MSKMRKFLKGGLLVALLAVLAIGGFKFMNHNERQSGHGQYQASYEQQGQFQGNHLQQYANPAIGDQREINRADVRNSRGEFNNSRGEHDHHDGWGIFAVIPLIFAGILVVLGWRLFKKSDSRYVKWIGGLLLLLILWPLALLALVIYAGWKLFNKDRRVLNYVPESYHVYEGLQDVNVQPVHNADFLDEWEKEAKLKRSQEDAE